MTRHIIHKNINTIYCLSHHDEDDDEHDDKDDDDVDDFDDYRGGGQVFLVTGDWGQK